MKTRKSVVILLLSILAALRFFPTQAMAADRMDPGQEVSLTLSYLDEGIPLAGAEFDLHLIATVDDYGELTISETFRQFNVDIRGENDDAWKALASTLEGFVLRDKITPVDSGSTNEQGTLVFPRQGGRLAWGLYLVQGHRHIQGGYVYDAAPFVVMLPSWDREVNEWVYDVTVNPKYSSQPESDDRITRKVLKVWKDEGNEKSRPEEVIVQLLQDGAVYDTVALNAANNWRYTWENLDGNSRWTMVEKEMDDYTVTVTREGVTFVVTNTYTGDIPAAPPGKPAEPKLPQTGQLWWPVPFLLAVGILLVLIGLICRRGIENEER